MERHFDFRAKMAKFQTHLCFYRIFTQLCHSKYHCRHSSLGNEKERVESDFFFLDLAFCFYVGFFYGISSCSCCFVKTDTFPLPRHIFASLSSYQMTENEINCVSWHISITLYPVSEFFQCITNEDMNRFMGI